MISKCYRSICYISICNTYLDSSAAPTQAPAPTTTPAPIVTTPAVTPPADIPPATTTTPAPVTTTTPPPATTSTPPPPPTTTTLAPGPSTCTGSESFSDMHIECSPGGISVAICESAFTNAGMSVSEIGLQDSSDSSCDPMVVNSMVEFNIPASVECGTNVENNSTHMVYSNTISGATGDVIGTISRRRTMEISFSCALQLGQR